MTDKKSAAGISLGKALIANETPKPIRPQKLERTLFPDPASGQGGPPATIENVDCLREQHGIVVEAYSPLTRGERLDHPVVRAIATETGRSSAQVLVRWGLQHGFVVLPKSVRQERIIENRSVFDFSLEPAQMERLDGLEENLATGWDPAEVD